MINTPIINEISNIIQLRFRVDSPSSLQGPGISSGEQEENRNIKKFVGLLLQPQVILSQIHQILFCYPFTWDIPIRPVPQARKAPPMSGVLDLCLFLIL